MLHVVGTGCDIAPGAVTVCISLIALVYCSQACMYTEKGAVYNYQQYNFVNIFHNKGQGPENQQLTFHKKILKIKLY